MTAEKHPITEKITFLENLDDDVRIYLVGASPEQQSLQGILDNTKTIPEVVMVELQNFLVETRGKTMKLVSYLLEDLARVQEATKLGQEEKDAMVVFNLRLEDEEDVCVKGSDSTMKPLQRVLDHIILPPETVSVSLVDLKVIVRGQILNFLTFTEFEREKLKTGFDLASDIHHFVRLELRKIMIPATTITGVLKKEDRQKKFDELVDTLARRIHDLLTPRFPISNPDLPDLSKRMEMIASGTLIPLNLKKEKAEDLVRSISSLEYVDMSILVKICDHPSNSAAVIEKLRGGVKK